MLPHNSEATLYQGFPCTIIPHLHHSCLEEHVVQIRDICRYIFHVLITITNKFLDGFEGKPIHRSTSFMTIISPCINFLINEGFSWLPWTMLVTFWPMSLYLTIYLLPKCAQAHWSWPIPNSISIDFPVTFLLSWYLSFYVHP